MRPTKYIITMIILLFSFFIVSPGYAEDIKCESHGFEYAECEVGLPITKANVKIQHSNSACIEDTSWGIENDVIWVDNGCRATFTYKVKPTIKCESHGFRYAECKAGAPIKTADVYIQHSNSACIEDTSWGIENDVIWVDNGCRATFVYKAKKKCKKCKPIPVVKEDIKCESHGFKYAECEVGLPITKANVKIQHSNSACIKDTSWGIRDDRDGIWVDKGCRATFETILVGDYAHVVSIN